MSECLEYIFCCFYSSNQQTQTGDNNTMNAHQKKKKSQKLKPKPSMIISKYRPEETIEMEKQDRKKGKMVYTCPICMLYFNRILACNQCDNNVCRSCASSYEKKFEFSRIENMKCPFCSSETSNFVDYEEAARSYFDTTDKNGFLDPMERKKIDEEMRMDRSIQLQNGQNNGSMQLYRIDEDEANQNVIPTENNIPLVQQYVEVEVRRNSSNVEQQEYQQESIANLRNLGQVQRNSESRPQMHAPV